MNLLRELTPHVRERSQNTNPEPGAVGASITETEDCAAVVLFGLLSYLMLLINDFFQSMTAA